MALVRGPTWPSIDHPRSQSIPSIPRSSSPELFNGISPSSFLSCPIEIGLGGLGVDHARENVAICAAASLRALTFTHRVPLAASLDPVKAEAGRAKVHGLLHTGMADCLPWIRL